jgi:TRAP-type C4-dicarboxylate transport system permease small subunit
MNHSQKWGVRFDRVIKAFWILSGGLLVFTTFSVILDVLLRSLFKGISLPWTIEVSEYMLFGITFFGAAWCLKIEGHIRVDVVFNLMSKKMQMFVSLLNSILGALTCIVFSFYAGLATVESLQKGTQLFKVLKVPKYYFASVMCLCSLLVTITFLRQAYGYFRMWKGFEPFKEKESGVGM